MRGRSRMVAGAVAAMGWLVVLAPACGSSGDSAFDDDGNRDGGPGGGGDGGEFTEGATATGDGRPCVGLECAQVTCSGGGTTSVSGVVHDPAGKVALYNVVVYVPNAPVADLATGVSCDKCASVLSGNPLVTTLTNTKGEFTLQNVPVGKNVPLVVQIGKWRRQITIPEVARCTDTKLDAAQVRLPRDQSEGHLPKIALATGGADALECLLRKIGIADKEITPETGTGRVNLYVGCSGTNKYVPTMNAGASFTNATNLWGDAAKLRGYDMVILSCEGGCGQDADNNNTPTPNNVTNKPDPAKQAIKAYADAGGRLFASHWHHYWFEYGPQPFPTFATMDHGPDIGKVTADIEQGFPKGAAFAEWLVNVGGSTQKGKIDIKAAQRTIQAENKSVAQRWIYSSNPTSVQYLTLNTPMGAAADAQCGRAVVTDIHVSSGDQSSKAYPSGCVTSDLSPQEKALEFMLFDLSSCIQNDAEAPKPPPIK